MKTGISMKKQSIFSALPILRGLFVRDVIVLGGRRKGKLRLPTLCVVEALEVGPLNSLLSNVVAQGRATCAQPLGAMCLQITHGSTW